MSINKGRVAAVIVAVAAIGFSAAGAANARITPEVQAAAAAPAPIPNSQGSVTGYNVKDGTLYGADIAPAVVKWFTGTYDNTVTTLSVKDGALREVDLSEALKTKLNDKAGQVTGLESDGPYPGSTKLQDHPGQGANSTEKVPADAKSHAVWVQCADGKSALGGGFRLGADQGDAVASKIQVTASEPTQIKDGAVVYTPIAGDAAGSVEPNGWLVEVINSGDTDATVRPFVTCATVAK